MGTQQIQRTATVEDELRSTQALLACLLEQYGAPGTRHVEIDPMRLCLAMMYPKKIDVKVRPSDGTFLVSAEAK